MKIHSTSRAPDILGGTPVFAGTRVPVRILLEHIEAGDSLDEFLENFPSVSREQAIDVWRSPIIAWRNHAKTL